MVFILFYALSEVSSVTKDEIGAGIDEGVGDLFLLFSFLKIVISPMRKNDDESLRVLCFQFDDLFTQAKSVQRIDAGAIRLRVKVIIVRVVFMKLKGAENH